MADNHHQHHGQLIRIVKPDADGHVHDAVGEPERMGGCSGHRTVTSVTDMKIFRTELMEEFAVFIAFGLSSWLVPVVV